MHPPCSPKLFQTFWAGSIKPWLSCGCCYINRPPKRLDLMNITISLLGGIWRIMLDLCWKPGLSNWRGCDILIQVRIACKHKRICCLMHCICVTAASRGGMCKQAGRQSWEREDVCLHCNKWILLVTCSAGKRNILTASRLLGAHIDIFYFHGLRS